MPSRLSSLLVRDGLVGVKRMERAFQRQVIYGGTLDTILLEMSLVPEMRLLQYLALATGLPPASRDETDVFDAEALKHCDEATARTFRVAPLRFADGALRVLVSEPVDLGLLEELATELDSAVQPLVVPEYRFHIVFARTYGLGPDARFLALASQANDAPVSQPVGKSASIIVDTSSEAASTKAPEPVEDRVVVDVALPPSTSPSSRTKTLNMSADAIAEQLRENERKRHEAEELRAAALGAPTQPMHPADTPLPAPTAKSSPPRPGLQVEEATALGLDEARQLLDEAEERDIIFSILLRAARGCANYVGLLTIQGGAAIGRIAIDGDIIEREQIAQVLIPVAESRAFAQAVSTAAPYIGPVATGDDDIDEMITRMGGVLPTSALLLPVALGTRVVAIVVVHRGVDALGAAEVAELLPLAAITASALSRIIVKRKAVGYRHGPTSGTASGGAAAGAPRVEMDELPTAKHTAQGSAESADDSGPWSEASAHEQSAEIEFGSEVSIEAGEPDDIVEVIDLVESDDEETSRQAAAEAVLRADEALAIIAERFPGVLRVDRYQLGGRILKSSEHGALLGLVTEIGAASADTLIGLMRDTNRERRYYATLCASELRPRSAIRALVERIFDADYGIRAVAIDGLRSFSARELDPAMVQVRHALHSEDAKRVQAAADAIAALFDISAIPDLLDANQRGDDGAPYARRALVALTKQKLGTSNRKWRSWWSKHKKQHRIEWLIDGLAHKDDSIRRSSAEELRTLTGEHFEFHHDLPKKEREHARSRWSRWWSDNGRRRFLRDERAPESTRSTAILPARSE